MVAPFLALHVLEAGLVEARVVMMGSVVGAAVAVSCCVGVLPVLFLVALSPLLEPLAVGLAVAKKGTTGGGGGG